MPKTKSSSSAKQSTQPFEKATLSRKALMINNFLGGLTWGVGSVLGATLLVALIGFVLAQAQTLPWIGQIAQTVVHEIESARSAP